MQYPLWLCHNRIQLLSCIRALHTNLIKSVNFGCTTVFLSLIGELKKFELVLLTK